MSTFGTTPADVVTDRSGNTESGIELEVWTTRNGTRITALYDLDGNALPGVVTTDSSGRYPFTTDDDRYQVTLRSPAGEWWDVAAIEAYQDVQDAVAIANQVAAHVQGTAQNAFELGAIPNSAAAAAANTAKLNAALEVGNVYIPPGLWYVSDTLGSPSTREIVGAGTGKTRLMMANGADINAAVISNKGNSRTPHTTPDRYIRIADLSIDANLANRAPGDMLNEGGCAIQLACVEYALIENVYASNGVHGIDVAASMYADVDPVTYPPGPSKWVVVRNCVSGSSSDDAFTTHGSQYLHFQNCVAWNEEGKPRNSYSNGIEIDDASLDVNITDFYAYKFHAGVQIKAHNTYPPARRVNVINAVADSCEYGFDLFWNDLSNPDPATLPDYAIAADVTLRNCRVVNLQQLLSTSNYLPALRVRSYAHVTVEDFLIQDSPSSNIILEYGCSNIRIDGVVAENSYTSPNGQAGLVNVYGSAGENVEISNVTVRGKTQFASPVVRIGPTAIKMLSVSRIVGNGTGAGSRAAVELLTWSDNWKVDDVIGTGYPNDIQITAGNRIGTYKSKIDNWLPSGVRKAADLVATYPPRESWLPLTADQATAGGWPGAGVVHTVAGDASNVFQYYYLNNPAAPRILYRVGNATSWGAWQQITIAAAA